MKERKQKKCIYEEGLETMKAKNWTFEDLVLKFKSEYSEPANLPETLYVEPMEMQTFGPPKLVNLRSDFPTRKPPPIPCTISRLRRKRFAKPIKKRAPLPPRVPIVPTRKAPLPPRGPIVPTRKAPLPPSAPRCPTPSVPPVTTTFRALEPAMNNLEDLIADLQKFKADTGERNKQTAV